jgi:hypothetical protein
MTTTDTTTAAHTGHEHCTTCGCCLSFAPAERTACGDCRARANGSEPDYSENIAAGLGRLRAARALNWSSIHPAHALAMALGNWDETAATYDDDVTARRMKRFYVDAFMASVEATRPA